MDWSNILLFEELFIKNYGLGYFKYLEDGWSAEYSYYLNFD